MVIFVAEILCDALSCRRMKRPFFACISVQFQKPAIVHVCDSETGYYISGPFELRNLFLEVKLMTVSVLMGSISWSDAALSCHAVVWDIARGEAELRALISCSSIVVGIREELHQCIG